MVNFNHDIASDATFADLADLINRHPRVTLAAIELNGPAGGNPNVRLVALDESAAIEYLRDHYGGDDHITADDPISRARLLADHRIS